MVVCNRNSGSRRIRLARELSFVVVAALGTATFGIGIAESVRAAETTETVTMHQVLYCDDIYGVDLEEVIALSDDSPSGEFRLPSVSGESLYRLHLSFNGSWFLHDFIGRKLCKFGSPIEA